MLDLRALVTRLIKEEQHADRAETEKDRAVVKAVGGRDLPIKDRIDETVKWLEGYRVLMGYRKETREEVVRAVLDFADQGLKTELARDEEAILVEFGRLTQQIKARAPRNKNGELREVVSLVSKALWCCYPKDVPIFDSNARSALHFISRACRMSPKRNDHSYARFLSVWFQVFREVEPLITPDCLQYCLSDVRVLDRILWYLGKSDYYSESPPS